MATMPTLHKAVLQTPTLGIITRHTAEPGLSLTGIQIRPSALLPEREIGSMLRRPEGCVRLLSCHGLHGIPFFVSVRVARPPLLA
jgi:hypothetical protein